MDTEGHKTTPAKTYELPVDEPTMTWKLLCSIVILCIWELNDASTWRDQSLGSFSYNFQLSGYYVSLYYNSPLYNITISLCKITYYIFTLLKFMFIFTY